MKSFFIRAVAPLALFVSLHSWAGTPNNGTLTPATPTLNYIVGPFSQSNPSPLPNVDTGPRCNVNFPCDSYQLTVTVPAGYLAANPNAKVRVTTSWAAGSPSDYDLHIYAGIRGDLNGTVVADVGASASSANPEVFEFVPEDGTMTTYTIKVVPYAVTPMEVVNGSIQLLANAPDPCDGIIPASVNAGSRVAKPMVEDLQRLAADSQYAAYVHFTAGTAKPRMALRVDLAAEATVLLLAGY